MKFYEESWKVGRRKDTALKKYRHTGLIIF